MLKEIDEKIKYFKLCIFNDILFILLFGFLSFLFFIGNITNYFDKFCLCLNSVMFFVSIFILVSDIEIFKELRSVCNGRMDNK